MAALSRLLVPWLAVIAILAGFCIQGCTHWPSPEVGEHDRSRLCAIQVPVFGPRTFTADGEKGLFEKVAFEVGDRNGGAATLRMVDGSQSGDGPISSKARERTHEHHVESAITLNGHPVARPDSHDDMAGVVDIPVRLRPGLNELEVKLGGKQGHRLTISVSAPIDEIVLKPLRQPLVVGVDKLLAQASVSGLGAPASGVDVAFSIERLGAISDQTKTTNSAGKASNIFPSFPLIGQGTLVATVNCPASQGRHERSHRLTARTPIKVIAPPPIAVQQSRNLVGVQEGQKAFVTTAVDFQPKAGDTRTYRILARQVVTPDDGGLTVTSTFPAEGWTSTQALSMVAPVTLTAVKPGTYTVTTTGSIADTGESRSVEMSVIVAAAGAVQDLRLGAPRIDPDGIPFGPDAKHQVTFASEITGTDHPKALVLREVDEKGKVIGPKIGELRDDGENGDLVKGDRFYGGRFAIEGTRVGEKRYVVTTESHGEIIRSSTGSLVVTRFPIGPGPLNEADAIADPGPGQKCAPIGSLLKGLRKLFGVADRPTGQKIAPDVVLVKFVHGLSEQIIEAIVKARGARVIGSLPALGVLVLAVPGNGEPADVHRAVAAFESLREVEFAEPNGLLYVGDGGLPPDKPCTSTAGIDCDWAATKVRADEAWIVGRGNSAVTIAIVDTGVNGGDDFGGAVATGYAPSDSGAGNCAGAGGNCDPDGHGTAVARLAAARRNNQGITGIAPEVAIYPVRVGNPSYWDKVAAGIRDAADHSVRVINLSLWNRCAGAPCSPQVVPTNNQNTVNAAIDYVGTKWLNGEPAILIVGIAGNHGTTDQSFPASTIHSKNYGIVVGATDQNDGRWSGSGYGSEVDIAAPGAAVCAGIDSFGNCLANSAGSIDLRNGTSFAAPQVAGAAALLFASYPQLTAAQAKQRLIASATPLSGDPFMGAKRLDVFEALFNGRFRLGEDDVNVANAPPQVPIFKRSLGGWEIVDAKNCGRLGSLGSIQLDDNFAYCQTGPGIISNSSSGIDRSEMRSPLIDLPPGDTGCVTVTFDHVFVTDEYDAGNGGPDPNWVGWLGPAYPYNDRFTVSLLDNAGNPIAGATHCTMDVDVGWAAGTPPTTPFLTAQGLDLPDASAVQFHPQIYPSVSGKSVDTVVGRLPQNRPTASCTLPLKLSTPNAAARPYRLSISIEDQGDQVWDSFILIDNVKFAFTPLSCPPP